MLCLVDVPSALDYGKKDKSAKFSVVGRTHLTQARGDKNFVHWKGGDRPQNTSTTPSPSRGAPFVGQTLSCWPCISNARRGAVGRLGVVSQEKLTLRLTRHWFRSVAQAALQEAQRVEKPSKAKARAGLCPLQDGAGRAERLGRFQTPPSRLPHPQQPCSTCWSGVGRNPPALPPSCPETRTGAETAWS